MRVAVLTHFAAVVSLVVLLVAGARPATAQTSLDGTYNGMGAASGAVIEITPDPGGFTGVFVGTDGNRQRFEADRRGEQASAVLDLDGRAVLMQMTPLPFGAEVAFIPFAADGRLEFDGARLDTFLREGLEMPETPELFVPAPRDTRTQIGGTSFLASYEFWRPSGVRDGYLSLAPRIRTLMRLFPAVQLDVIWKLCLAPKAEAALALALDGQGVGCPAVIDGLATAQRTGRFNDYKETVAAQKADLDTAVRCANRYVMPRGACARSADRLAEAALALETAASVLARYR